MSFRVKNGYAKKGDIITIDGYVNYEGKIFPWSRPDTRTWEIIGFSEYEGEPQFICECCEVNGIGTKATDRVKLAHARFVVTLVQRKKTWWEKLFA
jgi:hypothetical protein